MQRRVPVVTENATHPHHIDAIAHGAQTGDGGLRAHQISAGRAQCCGLQHRQAGGCAGRQVFADDQAVVQHHKRVVGLLHRQGKTGHRFALAIQTVGVVAIDHVQVTVAVNGHAAGPHGAAFKGGRAGHGLQAVRVYPFYARGGGQANLGAQGRVREQINLAGRAQHGHGGHQGAACGGLQHLARAQAQSLTTLRPLQPLGSAVFARPGAVQVTLHAALHAAFGRLARRLRAMPKPSKANSVATPCGQ